MRTVTLEEFLAELKEQGVQRPDLAFRCPMCKTIQSANDLIAAGAGKDFDEVEPYLGFSCVGRWLGAGSPRKEPDGKPCNWTLGGLLAICDLTVVTPDGDKHLRFAPATPQDAQRHAILRKEKTNG